MIVFVFYSFLLFLLSSLSDSKYIGKDGKWGQVKFVSVFFRHGDRTPYWFYPNDPYNNTSYWPEGLGQLTNIGKQQEFELGQWLRQRYDSLLTDLYSPQLIYAQSTDVDRTLMSAQCVLAGMYPPKGVQVWNDHLEWQPIPVHSVPGKFDNYFTAYAPCPAYDEEYEKVLKSKEIEEINEKYADVYKVLNENTGENKQDLQYIFDVYSVLIVEHWKYHWLPDWTKPVFPQPITEAASHSFTLNTRTKKLARFKAGPMVKSITDDMVGKISGGSRNVRVYSGHEHTLATLMNALGIFYLHNPPYAACLMVEMREDTYGEPVVTIFYRNSTLEDPQMLTIPGCAPACPLGQFISLTEHLAISPEEWDKECQLTSV